MKFTFKAKIYKNGINPCVDVPEDVSKNLAETGYIPIKGLIEKYPFIQTLVPVKNGRYRLFVNGGMLKGAKLKVGDAVCFTIQKYL